MNGVQAAAEDYQQRYYGAAQFQVVFGSTGAPDLDQDEHDQIFMTLMQPAVPVIRQLLATPTTHHGREKATYDSSNGAKQ